MQPRLKYWTVAPEAVKLMMDLNAYLEKSSIEASLRHLVKLRVSQINGCAYCVDLHSHEALRDGEKMQRIHCLTVWRETDLFTPRERAAFAYAESITLVADTHVPDEDYNEAAQHFDELELVDLTLAISTMNAWNRMAISFRRSATERRSMQAA
jgi:AhpD family alkylhydroperoxidase